MAPTWDILLKKKHLNFQRIHRVDVDVHDQMDLKWIQMGHFFSHFSVCSTLCDRSQMARLIKPIWNGGWTSIALSGIDRASTGCWHDIAGKMIAHLGTDRYPWNIMKPSSLRRWTSATPPESTTKCIVFFQCMGKQFDDLDLSSSHSRSPFQLLYLFIPSWLAMPSEAGDGQWLCRWGGAVIFLATF